MSIKSLWKAVPYLAIVPGSPNPPIIGIEYFDINTLIGLGAYAKKNSYN